MKDDLRIFVMLRSITSGDDVEPGDELAKGYILSKKIDHLDKPDLDTLMKDDPSSFVVLQSRTTGDKTELEQGLAKESLIVPSRRAQTAANKAKRDAVLL